MQQDLSSSRFVSALTKNTVALILAGGRGSRLKDLTNWRAKPAVPFGGKFRIIDFPLSNCMNSGIRRIGVVTQYKAHSLIQHIQRGWGFLRGEFNEFVELLPAQQRVEEEWYKGTADAVFQNLDILRHMGAEYILILAGDHIYKMDYGQMLASHVRNKADMTVACLNVPIEEAKAFGVMGVDEHDRIIQFREKPSNPDSIPGDPTQSLASMGIYVFNASFLYEQLIRDADDPDSVHDFGQNIIPHLISKYRVFAHRFADSCVNSADGKHYWRDVGTIDAYWEANMELTKVTPELNLYDSSWPIWTYQAQLPPAKFVFDSDDRRGKAVDSLISGGCIISGSCVQRSVLFSDVRVHSYSNIEDSVILPNVEIGRHVILKRVVIDKGSQIPEGMQIGVNPEEDRKRFHVSERGITLVTPEMLGQNLHHAR
ncbi:MAG TPA: glucose-1-phosphate adenylyltransferase [Methylophilaceae bacterium]|nr:glucose-1-phosphate adenylyltransferase [Methylophilaceae bacterium]